MNEKELFCKLFPEYAVNGKPLSPYFDLFERGYEQAEKRIAELEKRCANYEMNISKMEKGTCDICKETEKDKKILELEKENAELKTKVTALENANRAMVKELDDTTSGGLSVLENVVRSKEQLTTAKELLKQWLQTSKNNSCDNINIVSDTEQFLSEVEK